MVCLATSASAVYHDDKHRDLLPTCKMHELSSCGEMGCWRRCGTFKNAHCNFALASLTFSGKKNGTCLVHIINSELSFACGSFFFSS